MSDLNDAERDASEVVRLLTGLAMVLDRRGAGPDEDMQVLSALARDGGAAAVRVLEYLRALRGAGDGVAMAVPMRLGLWRDWVPPRGSLFAGPPGAPPVDELPRPRRRRDPGE
ncbi:hypothetical protein [Symbioplanes lichenis]|uniref:hypothetical protein n=1 Tax=Symbioplanes lichenis TaxID=1629072 RepID=UPI0027382C6A|nr:hypothetical protein [Actinoplanes lichenis]